MPRPKSNRKCVIEGCGLKHYARGWCFSHYTQWLKYGDPLTPPRRSGYQGPPHVVQHGTMNEYGNYGCRCDECKEAAAQYQKGKASTPCPQCGKSIWGRFRPGALCRECDFARRRTPLDQWHGTVNGYSRGCRCRACKDASNAARREYRRTHQEQERTYYREYKRQRRAALQSEEPPE
jgi:hypothetical protein